MRLDRRHAHQERVVSQHPDHLPQFIQGLVHAGPDHIGGPVRATLTLRDGLIQVAAPPDESAVTARFAASTFRSGNQARDAAVLSPRLLDAEAYPSLVFTSTDLTEAHGQWSLRGELEVRGVAHMVEVRLGASVAALQHTMSGQWPSASGLAILAAYAVAFGAVAWRFFRWE